MTQLIDYQQARADLPARAVPDLSGHTLPQLRDMRDGLRALLDQTEPGSPARLTLLGRPDHRRRCQVSLSAEQLRDGPAAASTQQAVADDLLGREGGGDDDMPDTGKLSTLTAGELTKLNGSAEYLLQVHALHGVLPAGLAGGLSQLRSDIEDTSPAAADDTASRMAELGELHRCARTLLDSQLDVVQGDARPYLLDIADRTQSLIAAMRAEADGYSTP